MDFFQRMQQQGAQVGVQPQGQATGQAAVNQASGLEAGRQKDPSIKISIPVSAMQRQGGTPGIAPPPAMPTPQRPTSDPRVVAALAQRLAQMRGGPVPGA